MNRFIDWIWPLLEKATPQEAADLKLDFDLDKVRIKVAPWEVDDGVALEEARRLNDAESDRRKTADGKAGIYLAAVTALVPVLTSLLPSIWSEKESPAFCIVSLNIFFLATLYLLRAGMWAFETLKVSASNRVDVKDLAKAWENPAPKPDLIKMLLFAVRANHDGVNRKVTCIKMTHAFLLRAFLAFILLLIVQVAWVPGASVVEWALGSTQQAKT